ncbi:MAG: cation:proton antiporter [Chthoniobacteraceae bacterium]
MTILLIFSIILILAVFVSEYADRSVLSTAVMFLLGGFVAGEGGLNYLVLDPSDEIVQRLAELALFSVLLTDGMKVSLGDLRRGWNLPGRALGLGLPLTMFGIAALCHYIGGISWVESMLVGAILSPTDPVFAAAIVGREEIPGRLRHLLNVESGLNDGAALPLVLVFLALCSGSDPELPKLAQEIGLGIGLGIAVPWVASKVEQSSIFKVSKGYEPLFSVAVGLLVLSLGMITHANLYLAAFSAGVTMATIRPDLRDEFHRFGELITELLKLAALLVFGALMSPKFLAATPWIDYLLAVLILVLARPVALAVAFLGTSLDLRERVTASWFGPKGFASAIYGLLLYPHGLKNADALFHLVAVVVALSIVAHSSTDVLIARWFRESEKGGPDEVKA